MSKLREAAVVEQAVRDRVWDLHFEETPACRPAADDAINFQNVLFGEPAPLDATAEDQKTHKP